MEAPPENTTAAAGRARPTTPATHPDGVVHVERPGAARRRVLAQVEAVPGFGWPAWDPTRSGTPRRSPSTAPRWPTGWSPSVVDPADGTFSLDGLAGLGKIVDDGDAGDTYNWSPARRRRLRATTPSRCR